MQTLLSWSLTIEEDLYLNVAHRRLLVKGGWVDGWMENEHP